MLLFSPTPGEIADRLTILALKLVHHRSVANLDEYVKCEKQLRRRVVMKLDGSDPLRYRALFNSLEARNAKQWELEDAVRKAIKELPPTPSYDELLNVTNIARENAFGNEDRARLKREIDALFGEEGEFKKYA